MQPQLVYSVMELSVGGDLNIRLIDGIGLKLINPRALHTCIVPLSRTHTHTNTNTLGERIAYAVKRVHARLQLHRDEGWSCHRSLNYLLNHVNRFIFNFCVESNRSNVVSIKTKPTELNQGPPPPSSPRRMTAHIQ